jgi:hypothetical protein
VEFGKMITTNGQQRFNSADGKETDAYFAILKN